MSPTSLVNMQYTLGVSAGYPGVLHNPTGTHMMQNFQTRPVVTTQLDYYYIERIHSKAPPPMPNVQFKRSSNRE